MTPRGGKRPGAGRPASSSPRRSRSFGMSDAEMARFDALREPGESRADCLMRLVEIFEGLGR